MVMHTWSNIWVQATPGFAFLFFLSQQPGAPDPVRSAAQGRTL